MRQFINPLPQGGVPFFADDFLMLQSELFKASSYLYASMSTEIILSGCDPLITAGNTINSISAGFVLMRESITGNDNYKLNIFYLPAQNLPSNTHSVWIVPDADDPETRGLKAGGTQTVVITKKAKVVTSQPTDGTTPFILMNPLPSVKLQDLLFRYSRKVGEIIPLGINPLDGSSPLFQLDSQGNNIPLFLQDESSSINGLGMYGYTGFAICNGKNGTADLRSRFLAGQDRWHSEFKNIGQIGGSMTVALTAEYLPPHTHSGLTNLDGTHRHKITTFSGNPYDGYGNAYEDIRNNGNINSYYTDSDGEHQHGFTTNGGNGLYGHAHDNLPPYYTSLFIQRIV